MTYFCTSCSVEFDSQDAFDAHDFGRCQDAMRAEAPQTEAAQDSQDHPDAAEPAHL